VEVTLHFIHRLTAATFGAALIASSVGAASAADPTPAPAASGAPAMAMPMPMGPAVLTNARALRARRLLPTGASLTGMLQRTNSCNKVAFQQTPLTIFPPVYRAVQIPVKRMPCLQVVQWVAASIAIPPRAKFVTVQAKNGTTKVIVH
jgi:hypothetical protein